MTRGGRRWFARRAAKAEVKYFRFRPNSGAPALLRAKPSPWAGTGFSAPISDAAPRTRQRALGLPSIHARSAATQLEENADMDIKPLGATPSRRMGADSFTGTVWQEPIIGTGTGADQGRVGTIRAESTHGMAHPSAGPNPARGLRRGPGSTVGRPAARNPRWRHGLDRAWRKALAWRRSRHQYGAHCPARGSRRHACRVAGARHR